MITVIKNNHRGEKLWQYTGETIARGDSWVCLDAYFNRDDVDAGYVVFRRGDRMTEWFYSDRWYNIFRLEDVDSKALKGWYCNITRPAQITDNTIQADDLALDVFIAPDGAFTLLDEEEFAALDLTPSDQAAALAAVEALRDLARQRTPPLHEIR